jgi:hypothetical protein
MSKEMTYKVTVQFKDSKTPVTHVIRGHVFPKEIPGFFIMIMPDDSEIVINLDAVKKMDISKECFLLREAQKASQS